MREGKRAQSKEPYRCLPCGGTGRVCDLCGDSDAVCRCVDVGGKPTYSDCAECVGAGIITPASKGRRGEPKP